MRGFRAAVLIVLAGCMGGRASAQQSNCRAPLVQPTDAAASMFTPQQEIDLGDVIAAQLTQNLQIAGDAAVVAHLNEIGERLAAHLPAAGLKFRYFVVDNPVPDAFSIAGGRIYVNRGLASFVRNEDELASIIAHEMGHIAAHQTAIAITTLFREVLGVNAVTSREEIVMDLSRLRETLRRNAPAAKRTREKDTQEQAVADEIGFYAAVSAGYSPQAFVDVFDRIAQTSGKTGNFLTDFFRTTTPDQRRLRDMMKMAQSLPAACIARRETAAGADFQRWKTAVLQFSNWNRRSEQLRGLLTKAALEKIIMRDVSHLSFSPDGKYILAREGDQLYVFKRGPFSFLFQIDASGAVEALFTSDSTKVAFTTALPHLEVWDIATQTRAQSFDLLERRCATLALSPQLDVLGCLGPDGALSLLDLPSGAPKIEKKHFNSGFSRFITVPPQLGFSPDGRYFLATGMSDQFAYDLSARRSFKLPAPLRDHLERGFAFLGSDRIMAGSPASNFNGMTLRFSFDAGIFSFPEGKLIGSAPVGLRAYSTPTRGDYVLLRAFDKYPIAVMSIKTGKVLLGIEQMSVDIYDDQYVRPLADGDLGLFDIDKLRLNSRTALPKGGEGAGFLRTFASPDLNWVAGCGVERCAVWNASTGKRVFLLRPFNAVWFDGEAGFYADFAKFRKDARSIGRLDFSNPSSASSQPADVSYAEMVGRLLIVGKPGKSGAGIQDREQGIAPGLIAPPRGFSPCDKLQAIGSLYCNVTWEFRDVPTGKLLWSRYFPQESPAISVEPDENLVLFRWNTSVAGAKEELKNSPEIAGQLAGKKDEKDFQLIVMADAQSGQVARRVVADAAAAIRVMGTRMIASHEGYMEIYSLDGMRKEGEILGRPAAYSCATGFMTVRGEKPNQIALYNLETREKVDEFAFPSNIALSQFSSDGKRLLVVTNDQTAYTLEIAAGAPASIVGELKNFRCQPDSLPGKEATIF